MSKGHFEFWKLNIHGEEIGTPQKVITATGVILQCHPRCNPNDVRHLCEIARKTDDYPVDIALWEGSEDMRLLTWSARIYWRI